ncbi:MAG TPA: CapA family protein, partial [Candidatus Obscuribacterales bacterium]
REGIHLIARPIGEVKPLWEQRIRVMTPALRERLKRDQGQGTPAMPPAIAVARRPVSPPLPGFNAHLFFAEQLKTMRAFMLTGSAVAAFVFGCMVEVVLSARSEPSLPFQRQSTESVQSQQALPPARSATTAPQLPTFGESPTVLADRPATTTAFPPLEATAVSYQVEPERDRPNVVNAALEPVGVLRHERVAQPADGTVTLIFGGDVDLDGLPYDQLEHEGQLLAGIPAYQQADLAMVNLQDPLAIAATSLEEEFLERQRPDAINLLKAGGVDIVNLAGEKALSFGEQGLAETLDNLDRNGIFRVGAGRSQREARRPEIVDVKGQRIAYLSYDRDFTLAAYDAVGGVNAVSMKEIIQDIQAIRDEVDWLVVNYRWTEIPPDKPAESQTNLARLAIDQGADVVVGHHPSELQGAEIYKGRPIAYSLGDFVFGSAAEAPTAETAVLQVSLRAGQMKVDLMPVQVQDGQPQQASGPAAQAILEKINAASQSFAQPMPASVVLEARPALPTDVPPTEGADTFTGEQESWTAPAEALPAAPAGSTAPTEALPADDATAPPASTPAAPPAADDLLDLELEPIPEDLLKNWGPKDSSNTIYEPESALPREVSAPAPPSPSAPAADAVPTAPAPKATPAAKDAVTPPQGAIAPYSEPLVGPMSSLPELSPEMKPSQGAIAPQPPVGMPESRIFAPMNTLEASKEAIITIDVKSQTAIAPATDTPD